MRNDRGINRLLTAAAGMALAFGSAAARGQSMPGMPGMTMPMSAKPLAKAKARPAKAKPAARKRATPAKHSHRPRPASNSKHARHAKAPAMPGMAMPGVALPMPAQGGGASMPAMTMRMPAKPAPGATAEDAMPRMAMPMAEPGGTAMAMPMSTHGDHAMAMTGTLGAYPMAREASGTAWQPDSSRPMGLMAIGGGWMLMAHGQLNLVADSQSGPRGDDKSFLSGMLMGMAQRPLGQGTLQLKAMISPDPLMGPSGYPLLLASGETVNGRDRLIDRQHPHDLFMELSASGSQRIGGDASLFVYAGLPGEPAFGPPAFMHRESIMDSPEAPITHHWLDSTHISFGVVTAGAVAGRIKLEASRFNGREPDQQRWDIETGPLDSTSLRLSWNPTRTLALQGSWARLVDPEQLEPGVDQTRWSASALWADDVAPGWMAAATLAWGRKSSLGHDDDGVAAEASLVHGAWTLFGRGELVENRELIPGQDGPAYRVGKISAGAIRDFPISAHASVGLGALASVNFVPPALAPLYGGTNPTGAMGFVRLKLD